MKNHNVLLIVILGIVFISGCTSSPPVTPTITGIQELLLSDADLQALGMIPNGEGCHTEEYQTSEAAPLAQYGLCNYTISELNTELIIEFSKFTNTHDLDGSYQYSSLHLRGLNGLISENTFGDFSRFYVNNESSVYYYHLWIGKNLFLVHITSKGSEDVDSIIEDIGERILSRFA